jgi:hypothetical protein
MLCNTFKFNITQERTVRFTVVFLNHYIADMIWNRLYPDIKLRKYGVLENLKDEKHSAPIFSYYGSAGSQLFIQSGLISIPSNAVPSVAFATLFAIQGAAFLKTLSRKGYCTPSMFVVLYGSMLVNVAITTLFQTNVYNWLIAVIHTIGRFHNISKFKLMFFTFTTSLFIEVFVNKHRRNLL